MSRNLKAQNIQDSSSDDDAPEVVSQSTSKGDAKRSQKALHNFEVEEIARKKARNRERDRKLKERARVTKGGKTGEKLKRRKFMDQAMEGDEGHDVEARMSRAMEDAADKLEGGETEDEEDGEFKGFGYEMDSADDATSNLDSSFAQDKDASMWLGESDSIDKEDDEEIGEDEETTSHQASIHGPRRKANYLADDLFAAAFASQSPKLLPKQSAEAAQQQIAKKQRKKSIASAKDLVIGGRTIRTLSRPSDPQSEATARSVPSAGARRFVDQSLCMKGKQAIIKAKKRGWERRPANIGVMKYQGAPHGFVRNTR